MIHIKSGLEVMVFGWRKATGKYLFIIICALAFVACEKDDVPEEEEDPGGTVYIKPDPGMDLYGHISDQDNKPVSNVVVSDGYSTTITGSNGIYQMKRNSNALFVFYSTPSGYEIQTISESERMASFYSKLTTKERYDFKLKKMPSVESIFTLICIGDPQPTNTDQLNRFRTETMQDISEFIANTNNPCYGLSMGDVVGDKPVLFNQMRALLGSTSMPVFTTIGNHDKVETTNSSQPRTSHDFQNVFGPANYSFNRGDVHFVCLDNVIFSNSTNYSGGFTDSQIVWLKEDLSYVSKGKMIIVYYHIPLRGTSGIQNKNQFLSALYGFPEIHLMCGHTHYNENYIHANPVPAYEHVHAAASGSWWKSTLNGDGTPNGYAVYEIVSNKITSWHYKPTKLDAEFQIRLHRGDVSFGGLYGYYSFDQGDNTIIANVWNSDDQWKIEAYEDGVKVADMEPLSKTSKDAWTLGYHLGVLNRNPSNYSPACKHLYKHQLVNPNAIFEVRATDRFGIVVYTQSEIIYDYTTAISY